MVGLKFFYLAEDEKPFFAQWYANSNDVIVCGYKHSDVDNDHCASCFLKYSHYGNEEWISVLPYSTSGLINSVTISFFPSKLKYGRWNYFGFILLKWVFVGRKHLFYFKLFDMENTVQEIKTATQLK